MRRQLTTLALLGTLLVAAPARAAKTDVVIMRNGDRLTCEIKNLEHSKLTVSTDDMGTIYIEWDKIVRISSAYYFLVRTTSGFLHYGRFPDSGQDGMIDVEGPGRTIKLEMADIAMIEPIKTEFWDKFELLIALGYSYTKSTSVQGFTFESRVDYRGRVHRAGGRLMADVSDNDTEIKRIYDLTGYFARVVSGKWYGLGSGGARRHDELGLQLRLRAGGGMGYRLLDSRRSSLSTLAGVYWTREWATGSDAVENTGEGTLAADFSIFIYDSPKTDINISFAVMPSFTVKDRVRWEIDAALSRELFKDFYIQLGYFEARDNRPLNPDASTSDRSVTLNLKWTRD